MAFRRRARRGGFRRRRPVASAFAPARSGGGHLDWEAAGTTCWDPISSNFSLASNTYDVVCDSGNVQYITLGLILVPIVATRGIVTLLRVRGFLGTAFDQMATEDPVTLRNRTCHFMLQMVPKDQANVNVPDGFQLLSGNLAANQESNRILNQWVATTSGMHATVEQSDGVTSSSEAQWFREIDVRVKRRFHRPQWALVLSATIPSAAQDSIKVYANFRMLFRADDGM